uniref:Uncharacterized protein n=1 Tax=Rhizophora mucronata TaxID=61149 RepID=A0A2P2IPH8_RHIMU
MGLKLRCCFGKLFSVVILENWFC